MRDHEGLCNQVSIFKLDLYLGDAFKHELVHILVFELIVEIYLALQDLSGVVAEEGTRKEAIFLNLLLSTHEVLISAIKIILRRQVLFDAQHSLGLFLMGYTRILAEPGAP